MTFYGHNSKDLKYILRFYIRSGFSAVSHTLLYLFAEFWVVVNIHTRTLNEPAFQYTI